MNPAISLLSVDPKKSKTLLRRDTRTPVFTAVLFTTPKTWTQTTCPSADEWTGDEAPVHHRMLLSHAEGKLAIGYSRDGPAGYRLREMSRCPPSRQTSLLSRGHNPRSQLFRKTSRSCSVRCWPRSPLVLRHKRTAGRGAPFMRREGCGQLGGGEGSLNAE